MNTFAWLFLVPCLTKSQNMPAMKRPLSGGKGEVCTQNGSRAFYVSAMPSIEKLGLQATADEICLLERVKLSSKDYQRKNEFRICPNAFSSSLRLMRAIRWCLHSGLRIGLAIQQISKVHHRWNPKSSFVLVTPTLFASI